MKNGEQRWALALTALDLLHTDPTLKGLIVGSAHGPVQQAFADIVKQRFARITPIPTTASSERLLGGLDISQSLALGKPVHQTGLLEQDQGALIINGAERLDTTTITTLSAHLDSKSAPGSVMIIMDESTTEEPGLADTSLAERLSMLIELPVIPIATLQQLLSPLEQSPLKLLPIEKSPLKKTPLEQSQANHTEPAPKSISAIVLPDDLLLELTKLAQRLGVDSMRILLFAIRVARAHAAMHARDTVTLEDAAIASQLVLSPRALGVEPQEKDNEEQLAEEETEASSDSTQEQETPPETDIPPPVSDTPEEQQKSDTNEDIGEQLLEAASATLPEHLIANLVRGQKNNQRSGRDSAATGSGTSGRPTGVRRPRGSISGERLNIIETLKAAIPKQRLRGNNPSRDGSDTQRIKVRAEDFRITRFKQPTRTTTVFVVDASGSAALHRLAEAKGAVELLLAECYVRRDRVAMISFRGTTAQLELPPTRSLVRAKRELAQLPGGGGTPLASGLDLATQVVQQLKQAGETPVVILMTDGKANIARDGMASRSQAMEDAHNAARLLASTNARCLFVDTAPRAREQARELASVLQARYLPLPAFNSQALPDLVGA